MKLNRVLSFLLLFPIMATAWAANDYTQYVNPWIGTGGHGHVFLGANVPWGYVQLGSWVPLRIRAAGTGARAITSATQCS